MGASIPRLLIVAAAVMMAIATALGAYASHGLDGIVSADAVRTFETGVTYQFVHALGVLGVAVYAERHRLSHLLPLAAVVVLAGTVLFCGGVYASALGGPGAIAAVAPAGGVCLIAGWLMIALAVLRIHVGQAR
jgi:uncharacterized membrane protein YgdD (TMEM256/DUF423 family)